MPSIYLPRLATAIIALMLVLYGLSVTLKGDMSKHFAIDMELFHLCLHLQILEMGQYLEMHQPRALHMLL
jgi:multisubunit Na+/H+ antiporter MnhC subunit